VNVRDALREAERRLADAGIETPRVDAEWLVAHVLGTTRSGVYARLGDEVELDGLVERRAAREPLADVLGDWGFRRLTLKTDARALVPRPETEIVVERCLALLDGAEEPRVADVGTGTGAIALALKDERPDARVVATDASMDALALARENADANGLDVHFVQADLLTGVAGPFDLVVSNPPYVEEAELETLQPELTWEPRAALLDAGQTARLAREARAVLGGWLVLEVHAGRARSVADELAAMGYEGVSIERDLAGRERVVEARWPATATSSGR
jgi:release factor glutamine methyltransferase